MNRIWLLAILGMWCAAVPPTLMAQLHYRKVTQPRYIYYKGTRQPSIGVLPRDQWGYDVVVFNRQGQITHRQQDHIASYMVLTEAEYYPDSGVKRLVTQTIPDAGVESHSHQVTFDVNGNVTGKRSYTESYIHRQVTLEAPIEPIRESFTLPYMKQAQEEWLRTRPKPQPVVPQPEQPTEPAQPTERPSELTPQERERLYPHMLPTQPDPPPPPAPDPTYPEMLPELRRHVVPERPSAPPTTTPLPPPPPAPTQKPIIHMRPRVPHYTPDEFEQPITQPDFGPRDTTPRTPSPVWVNPDPQRLKSPPPNYPGFQPPAPQRPPNTQLPPPPAPRMQPQFTPPPKPMMPPTRLNPNPPRPTENPAKPQPKPQTQQPLPLHKPDWEPKTFKQVVVGCQPVPPAYQQIPQR